jgi:hypothetical protein
MPRKANKNKANRITISNQIPGAWGFEKVKERQPAISPLFLFYFCGLIADF